MIAVRSKVPIALVGLALASFGLGFAYRHEVDARKQALRAQLDAFEAERGVLLERLDRVERELDRAWQRVRIANEQLDRQRALRELEVLRVQHSAAGCHLPRASRVHISNECKENPLTCID
jgi:hypothetical protein